MLDLLSKFFSREKLVNIEKPTFNKLEHSELVSELKKINSSIKWNGLREDHKQKNDLISIVILVLNNLELTRRCVDSIYNTKTNSKFEVILFNNGSEEETTEGLKRIKKLYPSLKLIRSTQNLNFAVGNNIAFSYAKGSTCVFMNNDTYVTDFWLDNLIKYKDKEKLKAVQPSLFYPDDSIQCIGVVFSDKSSLGYPIYSGIKKKSLVKDRYFQAVTGACLAIDSLDFISVKGFDPAFVNGQEDVDLCLRLGQKTKDKVCGCTQESIVYHDESKTPGRGKYVAQNRLEFVRRWKDHIRPDDKVYYREDGYYVESWSLDSEKFLKMGIQIYTPTIKKR